MLEIIVPAMELYDEEKNLFFNTRETKLLLEHSLISVSKWESKWKIPFLSKYDKTSIQSLDYVRCMTINQGVEPYVYSAITKEHFDTIRAYIDDPMTATAFAKPAQRTVNNAVVTSEVIYYWMVMLQIPWDAEKWHLNRLLTFINYCNIKNQPKKKVALRDIYKHNLALNEQRRAALNSKG